jgi:hypothetical protein
MTGVLAPDAGHVVTTRARHALPYSVAPFQDETLTSYHRRLAAANHLDVDDLLIHVTGCSQQIGAPARHLTADQLAAISGRPQRTLLLALPELRAATPGTAGLPQRGRTIALVNRTAQRPACRRCTAARGITGEVTRWVCHDQNVCLAHRLWIGKGVSKAEDQTDLTQLPDLLAAQRRHTNLIRRHGHKLTARSFQDAAYISRRWAEQGYWSSSRGARTLVLFGTDLYRLYAGDPLLPLVTYPEAVGLTSLLASRYWHEVAAEANRYFDHRVFDRFCDEVARRTGISGYQLHGPRDPLQQWCDSVRQRSPGNYWADDDVGKETI